MLARLRAYGRTMATRVPISQLEDDERRARIRLAAFRARVLRRDGGAIAFDRRLRELQRQHRGALEGLRRERRGQGRGARGDVRPAAHGERRPPLRQSALDVATL